MRGQRIAQLDVAIQEFAYVSEQPRLCLRITVARRTDQFIRDFLAIATRIHRCQPRKHGAPFKQHPRGEFELQLPEIRARWVALLPDDPLNNRRRINERHWQIDEERVRRNESIDPPSLDRLRERVETGSASARFHFELCEQTLRNLAIEVPCTLVRRSVFFGR